jgi:hypothetical protein
MKKLLGLLLSLLLCVVTLSAQHLKKDGTPDMRYKENKQAYGNSYVAPVSKSTTNTDVQYQDGYTKSDGTIVESHYKTKKNSTNTDNFSTKGNVNPYTGKSGAKAKDYSPDAKNYGKGKTIYTGSKGGQYYINDKGNKVYVPKR